MANRTRKKKCPIYSVFTDGTVHHESDDVLWRKDGKCFPAEYRCTPIKKEGAIIGAVVTFSDISMRKTMIDELATSEERLNLAVISAGIGIWDWHIAENTLIWSESMHQLFGTNPKTFSNDFDGFLASIHPSDRNKLEENIREATESKDDYFRSEYRIMLKKGVIKIINAEGRLHYDDDGNAIRMTGVCKDISVRKQAQQSAEKYLAELLETNKIMQQKNQEIQNFYQTVSHELKTPLTSINEFISILLDGLAGPLNEKQSEYLKIAKRNCGQMVLFINDLLDVSKLDTGKLVVNQSDCDLHHIIDQSMCTIEPLANSKQLALNVEIEDDLKQVYCDQQRIIQVITNLLNNAFKFTKPGGKISIIAKRIDPEQLKITVVDTGYGIDEKDLKMIFERLYQVDKTQDANNPGLGLGLNICKQIANLHDSKIEVESQVGVGSRFSFNLKTVPAESTTTRSTPESAVF